MNRRKFIRNTGLATTMLFVPSFIKAFEKKSFLMSGQRRLVVIQLSGGNDGLNTIIPYNDDAYYQQRPTIGIPKTDVIALNDQLGYHPAMKALKPIYDQGWSAIINNVGYPNPDRSHFRSMDIWHTASASNEYLSTGWLGRYLDAACYGCENPYHAIEVDDTLSLALKGEFRKALAVKDPAQLYNATREPFFHRVINANNYPLNQAEHSTLLTEDNLGYLYKTMAETASSADYIYQTIKTYKNTSIYPQSDFSKRLKTIATFINSGLQTQVYYVSLGGFDTHVGQLNKQEKQLQVYAEGVAAFINDLQSQAQWKDTLILTFSEFGRRVSQNASNGTDHGTANNIMIYSGSLKKQGILNASPDLINLDEGDLKFKVDFRAVYSQILENWLGAKSIYSNDGITESLNFI